MTERRDEPLTGDVIESTGNVRAYSWEWSAPPGAPGRSRLPWFGIFLVVLGALLLLQNVFPAFETSILFLAIGLAFLVSFAINRGTPSLYLGAIITALAAPDLLIAAGAPDQPGLGTLCLGLAFLGIAIVRGVMGHGVGWQAGLGVLLLLVGASSYAIPGFNDLVWPIVIVVIGVVLLLRANAARA